MQRFSDDTIPRVLLFNSTRVMVQTSGGAEWRRSENKERRTRGGFRDYTFLAKAEHQD